MRSAPSTRPSVSIACVASMYMHAAVVSISEEAMPSAPVSDSWEGPKRRDATGDAIFGNRFFDSHVRTPPIFDLGGRGVRKLFFGNRRDTVPRWSEWSLEAQAC